MRRLAPALALTGALAATAACGPDDDGGGGACEGLVAGSLVISEVLADYAGDGGASGADAGREWFEIYNASSAPIELAGVVVTHLKPDDSDPKRHVIGTVTIDAGGYLTLGNVPADVRPAHVAYGYDNDLGDLYQAGGKLQLSCGAVLVDEASYADVASGRTRALDGKTAPDYLANDDQTAWCTTAEDDALRYEPANFGTPGAANQDCMIILPGQCDDGGTMRATVPPAPGDLVITEVMPSPAAVSDTTGEWFEVLVNRDVDLNGVGLDRAGDSTMPNVLASPDCLRVTAGTHLVFARSTDGTMNGMLPRVDGQFTFSLVGGTAASPGDVRLVIDTVELDSFAWTSSRNGRTLQLDAGLTAPADNDVAGNVCDGNAIYGAGDLGTPGAANRDCGTSTSGMCTDGAVMRPIVTPTAGQVRISEWMPDPTAVTDANGEWFEVQALADVDLNGLQAGTTTLGMTPIVAAGGPCLRVASGGFALFARNATAATNGNLPAVDATEGLSLVQSNGTLQIGFGGSTLSMVTWTASAAGRSIMIDSDGTQCNAPDGVAMYNAMDRGTPRAANVPPECP